jgi:hypothetical protein
MNMTRSLILGATGLLLAALPAAAYIEALTAMGGVVKESDVIARGTVDAVSLEKKVLILKVGKTAKGKTVYEKIRIDMGAGEAWHPEVALKHAVVGTPVSIFYRKADNSEHAQIALLYLNRFFMTAQGGDPVWRFSKIELAMNRVFHGTPEARGTLMEKVVAGRVKAPAPQAELKPWTKEALEALPPPPREGEKWADFDASGVFKR